MKTICRIFAVALIPLLAGVKSEAQSVVYERTLYELGATSSIPALGIALDIFTNNYVLGSFSSTTTIHGTVLANAGGWPDIFVAKLIGLGVFVQWVKAPVTDFTISNASIGCDLGGDSYLAGTFAGTNLAFGAYSVTNYSSDHSSDIFFAKYDSTGNAKLVNRLGGTGNDALGGMVAYTNGECFLTGVFQSPTFAAGTSNLVRQGTVGGDCFTARLGTNGNVLWLEQGSNAHGTCVALDASTNCYVGGYVTGPAAFDGVSPANPVTTNFLAKYYYAGGLAWVRGDLNLGKFIGLDAAGNLYTAGTFSNQVQFGSLPLANSSASTIFVAKYDPNGNALWARQLPGLGADGVTGLLIDRLTNCWVSGYFANPSSPAKTIAVVAQLNASGSLGAISQITSPMSSAAGLASVVGPKGPAIFVGGNYATNFTIHYLTVTNGGNLDIFGAWILAPPALATFVSSTNLVCTWPNGESNLVLQSSSDLSNWSTVTNPVSTANGQNTVTNAMPGQAGFFRLQMK